MRLLAFVLLTCFYLGRRTRGQEVAITRYADGDIFIIEGSCKDACTVLSSGTAGPYTRRPSSPPLSTNGSCVCQCNADLPVFREDLHICVNDIHECNVAGFVSGSGLVERVPYVFLPQRGQIIYPHAEIRFEGVSTPVCGIAGAQQLGKAGWFELRNLSDSEPPFKLFRDEGRTFLRWSGESALRDATEGRLVIAKLVCRDAAPNSTNPSVFSPCVAFRVAGSTSKNNVREVTFSSTTRLEAQGLSTTEYTAIGLSSALLALIYVASVSLYLHSRRAKRKCPGEACPELASAVGPRDVGPGGALLKNNPLLAAARSHLESDTNSGFTESDPGDDVPHSDAEQAFDNVTSAIVHPRCIYLERTESGGCGGYGGSGGNGTILGERLPEEDVRVVETADNGHQQDMPVLPGSQRRKLYFNPAYFDRQLLLAPPPAAIEFLLKIREVIAIAKHKMAAKRFIPTLVGIPEEEGNSERCNATNRQQLPASSARSTKSKKSQKCSGCPGCTDTQPSRTLPAALPLASDQQSQGERRVRAWLQDVKPPQRCWRDAEDIRRNFQENAKTFARNLEYLKELAKGDLVLPERMDRTNAAGKPLSAWKDNPPMLRTFQNIARSEILENAERYSVSKRSTKSMFEESYYGRRRFSHAVRSSYDLDGDGDDDDDHDDDDGEDDDDDEDEEDDNGVNAKVRRAIENSFAQQMRENAIIEQEEEEEGEEEEGRQVTSAVRRDEGSEERTRGKFCKVDIEEKKPKTNVVGGNVDEKIPRRSGKKSRAPSVPTMARGVGRKDLPDMLNELPSSSERATDAKRIMDAVIREMVDVKSLEHRSTYETDSLERTRLPNRVSSTSPDSTDQSSPALSTALPMDEELTMQNAVISTRSCESLEHNERSMSHSERQQRTSEAYSLVSEVYVNDGYASPANSDDSGPEIRYEPENPGHLTIKVQDSPENYVKQDESEYEPDTLDRKPMRLKVNEGVNYEKEMSSESYVDSLERPAQILLRSKGSFRDENGNANERVDGNGNDDSSLRRGYGSLREIYEAKLRSNLRESELLSTLESANDGSSSARKRSKYLTPETRQAKRQRQPQNQPDVIPLPPTESDIYQRPKPPRPVENASKDASKNAWDGRPVEAGDPTAGNGSPVLRNGFHVGTNVACSCSPVKRRYRETATGQKFPVEDSGYLSSTDSNGSQKRLLRHEISSISETDGDGDGDGDGASESGAESIGTDSVFFGNFKDLYRTRNHYLGAYVARNATGGPSLNLTNGETESFVAVLPPNDNQIVEKSSLRA